MFGTATVWCSCALPDVNAQLQCGAVLCSSVHAQLQFCFPFSKNQRGCGWPIRLLQSLLQARDLALSLIEQNKLQKDAGIPGRTGGDNPSGNWERLEASRKRRERELWDGHMGYSYEQWVAWWEGGWKAGEAGPPAESEAGPDSQPPEQQQPDQQHPEQQPEPQKPLARLIDNLKVMKQKRDARDRSRSKHNKIVDEKQDVDEAVAEARPADVGGASSSGGGAEARPAVKLVPAPAVTLRPAPAVLPNCGQVHIKSIGLRNVVGC